MVVIRPNKWTHSCLFSLLAHDDAVVHCGAGMKPLTYMIILHVSLCARRPLKAEWGCADLASSEKYTHLQYETGEAHTR